MKKTEGALRSRARLNGYRLCKSRKSVDLNNFGEYMLIDVSRNAVVLGGRFDATLDDVASFLND